MKRCWRLLPGVEPALHRWGDEYVVHHRLSNDTYRVSATAGRLLGEFIAAASAPADGEAGVRLADDAEAAACLSALSELGFVAQC